MIRKKMLAGLLAAGLVAGAIASATTITVQVPFYSSFTKPFMTKMATAFEKENPGIKVAVQEANWDNLHQVLVTDIAGKSAPDISIIGTRWLPGLISSKVAMPLNLNKTFLNGFIPAFLKPSTLGGTLYGLPWAASDRALIYNKDLFKRAGITSPPTSWNELRSDAQKIAKLPGAYGFGLQGSKIETDVYYYYALWGAGGSILSKNGKSGLSSPEALKALKFYTTLINNGLTEPNVTSNTREDLRTLFVQGRLGMFIYLPPIIGYLKKFAPKLDYGVSAIPYDTTPLTYAVTDTIMMFQPSVTGASEAQVEAGQKFLEYLFNTDNRVDYNQGEGFLPVMKAVAGNPHFKDNAHLNAFVSLLPYAKFAPIINNWEKIAQTVTNMLQEVYLGKVSPAAGLKSASAQVDQVLSK